MGMFLRRGYAQRGTRASDLEIGQTIQLNVGGKAWDWLVVQQGLPSSIYDASCDGTWLLMKDIYEERQWNSSRVNNLENSTIHSYLNNPFLNLFDPNIRDAIKQVKIPHVNGESDSAVASGAKGLSAKIFLLSGYEVGWTQSTSEYFPVDGACLSYFSGMTSTDSKRIGYMNGVATDWWLRSAHTNTYVSAWEVVSNGNYDYNVVTASYGIRPALILPSDFIVSEEMLAA